jgi:hypothetical protein
MWTVILFAVAGGFIAVLADGFIEDSIIGAFLGALVGFMVAMMVGLAVHTDTEWYKSKPVTLESLVDGKHTEGEFFLGSGVINDVSKFTWYEETGNNSYEQRSAYADDSTVHFIDSGEEPYYIVSEQRYTGGRFVQPFSFDSNGDSETGLEHYDFYVPQGTIARNFELDAE